MEQINLKLKRTKINLELDDKNYALSRPNFGEMREFESKRKTLDEKDQDSLFELMLAFLEKAGLPKDVTLSLEPEMVNLVVEHLTSSKKN